MKVVRRYVFRDTELAIILARCEGTSVVAEMKEQDEINYVPAREELLGRARAQYETDECEIDEDAPLSPSEDGCWVQAWVWLYNEEEDK